MPNINDRKTAIKNIARGFGYFQPLRLNFSTTTITPADVNSGFLTAQLGFNRVGSTPPGTLVGIQLPPSLSNELFISTLAGAQNQSTGRGNWLCYLYKLGTLNLAATGNQFTHDAATFPVTRTQLGVVTQPLTLTPVVYITTATATTAPVFRLRTVAAGSGYTNQDGTSIVGTKTMTMPAAATLVESGYVIRLENNDSGVRDITNIEVTTAGTAGAADVYGVELLAPLANTSGVIYTIHDALTGPFSLQDLKPASPTSGSLTSYLAILNIASTSGSTSINFNGCLLGVLNK